MRVSVVIPIAVLCLCACVLAGAWRARAPATAPAHTGMGLLRDYPCRRSETKVVLVKGVEDGFSPAGNEPGFLRPGLDTARWRSLGAGSYDQSQPDRFFVDSLRVPAHVHDGLFVIGLKPLPVSDSITDTIGIGDLRAPSRFGSLITELPKRDGWTIEGTLYSAELARIMYNDHSGSLLTGLREGAQAHWLDVSVQDDTSVDFIGLAACVEPPRGKGVTLATDVAQPPSGAIALSCRFGPENWPACDPYVGDTACATALPIACLLPGEQPPPRDFSVPRLAAGWTGGDIAFTEPVAAAQFHRIAEVDAFCATHFGTHWRTLTSPEGLPNLSIVGRGRPPSGPVRAWVDEVNQPYGTCWAR